MSKIKVVILDKDNTLVDLETYCKVPIIETAKYIVNADVM